MKGRVCVKYYFGLLLCAILIFSFSVSSEPRSLSDSIADVSTSTSFKLKEEQDVSLFLEHYVYGERQENVLEFEVQAVREGEIYFSMISLPEENKQHLLYGAIGQIKSSYASAREVIDIPTSNWTQISTGSETIKKSGETTLGILAYGDDDSNISLPIDPKRGDFVKDFESMKTVYVIVAAVK